MLPLQLRQGLVPELPGVVVDIHIQHHQPTAGGDAYVVQICAIPPCRDLTGGCCGILTAVG